VRNMQSVKLSDEAYNYLKELSDKTGKSIRELIEQAVNIAFKNVNLSKDVIDFKQALITAKYEGECSICHRKINPGDMVLWLKYTYADKTPDTKLICLECYFNDKTMAKMYLKKKELEQVIRGLKKMADSLSEEVRRLQNEVNVYLLRKRLRELYDDVRTYLQQKDESKLLEVIDRLNQLEEEVSKLKEQHVITKPTTKPKSKEVF
jgi:hypothetical protein